MRDVLVRLTSAILAHELHPTREGRAMFGSQILEIAMGLFFVYLFFSILCSALNEVAARLTNDRFQGPINLRLDVCPASLSPPDSL
jgi:hypothetical protein